MRDLKKRVFSMSRPTPVKRKAEPPTTVPLPSPPKSKKVSQEVLTATPEYRLVNWVKLTTQLDKCTNCNVGPLNLKNTISERRAGLAYISGITCMNCNFVNVIRNDDVHEDANKRGPKRSTLNECCVLGVVHSGNGHAQLQHLFAPMNLKGLHSATYKETERRVGKHIEQVASQSCQKWLQEEKKSTDGNDLAISYDM